MGDTNFEKVIDNVEIADEQKIYKVYTVKTKSGDRLGVTVKLNPGDASDIITATIVILSSADEEKKNIRIAQFMCNEKSGLLHTEYTHPITGMITGGVSDRYNRGHWVNIEEFLNTVIDETIERYVTNTVVQSSVRDSLIHSVKMIDSIQDKNTEISSMYDYELANKIEEFIQSLIDKSYQEW